MMQVSEMRKNIKDEEVLIIDKIYLLYEGQLAVRPNNISKLTNVNYL